MAPNNNKMKEKWKFIKGYEDLYEVSNFGRIRNRKFVMKVYTDKAGYIYVALSKNKVSKKYKVHRLVAGAFIRPPKLKEQVNHKSGVKCDNYVTNLEWVSAKENQVHAYKNGLKHGKKGIENPSWIAKINQLNTEGKIIKTWDSLRQIMRETGFDKSAIARNIRGDRNYSHAYGFKWSWA